MLTEPESADDTAEMVFTDDAEDVGRERAAVVPRTTGRCLAGLAQERRQPGGRQCVCCITALNMSVAVMSSRQIIIILFAQNRPVCTPASI